ncbi:MAG: hypothetical protein ACPGC5_02165 [Flavobacteriaceae bacterium]
MKVRLPKFAAFLSLYFLCLPGLYAFHMALEEHHAYELTDDTNHPFRWETEPHNCDLCDLYQQYQWTSEDLIVGVLFSCSITNEPSHLIDPAYTFEISQVGRAPPVDG